MPANGHDWLLLRGLCREAGHWGNFLPLMQAAFPDVDIHTADLPGTGAYHQLDSPADIPAITAFVRSRLRERGLLDRPLNLLALSLGGMAGWHWLQQHPADLATAVLVNTSFASLSPFHRRLRWQNYARLAAILAERDVYRRELAIVQLVSNRDDCYPAVAAEWGNIQLQRPISAGNGLRQILAAARYRPAAGISAIPVLLLNSLGDRLVTPDCSRTIAEHCGLELRSHPWGGHDLCLDDGEWVTAQLRSWLEKARNPEEPPPGASRAACRFKQ